jgi:vancomycin permeability regulator SanA
MGIGLKSVKFETHALAPPVAGANKGSTGRRKKPRRTLIMFLLVVLLILSPFLIVQCISLTQEPRIYTTVQATPSRPVALVFGAGLNRDGSPSLMLADRLDAAIALYRAGKVQSLLMTGDEVGSIEPTAMRDYALQHGIPRNAITLDTVGLRTYDSCYRARHTFNVTKAILVTQGYHLPRALYTCEGLGLDVVGLKAGRDNYPNQSYYNSREFMATLLSWVEITITRPTPPAQQ